MAQLTADWNPMGRDIFYRKFELYSMAWVDQINLKDYHVAIALYGGPIAVVRDDSKRKVSGTVPAKPVIFIFSPSGTPISTVKWNSGTILHMGWSVTQDLLVIQDDGSVLKYDIFGVYQSTFSMGQEARDKKVIDCRIFHSGNCTGIAVLTTSFKFFVITNVSQPRIRALSHNLQIDSPPNCWTVFFEDNIAQVYLAYQNQVHIVGMLDSQSSTKLPNIGTHYSEIIQMAFSFNYKHLAMLTNKGILWIGSADMERMYLEFDCNSTIAPMQLVWCGSHAVVIAWENLLMVIGLNNNNITYPFRNFSHEFLYKIPSVVASIFMIGSISPGAILLEASKEFQKKSHRADDYLRTIRDQIEEGVSQCIEAAGHEYFSSNQKTLLRAASFGKSFIPEMDSKPFYNMCQTLRVLNAIRDFSVSIPLTYAQYSALTMPVLVDHLVLRRYYSLAIKICQYLRIPDVDGASKILTHWAKFKVMQSHNDEAQLAKDIAAKLGKTIGVSYSDISSIAISNGKKRLATKLLVYEPHFKAVIPHLLELKEFETALSSAIESGDSDLMFSVIFRLHSELPQGEFLLKIRRFPTAYSLYLKFLKFCQTAQQPELSDLYYQEDNFLGEGNAKVIASYQCKALDDECATLQTALNAYKKSRNEFLISSTEQQIQLLKMQKKLNEKYGKKFNGMALHETILQLLMEQEVKAAEELKKTFKVPDKRYCWIKIQACGHLGDWAELERIGKKPSIGYEPLVDVCLRYNNVNEALKYLHKVQNNSKVKYYVKAGRYEDAARIAIEQRDESALNFVISRCSLSNDKALLAKITSLKGQQHGK
ncbi:Vacuolar protein sorting-associated protein 16 [Chamberlinius hualienensis]